MGYIDIHCHVLPGVDDGSSNMDETVEMLKIAASQGISDMIVTPHYKQGRVGTPKEVIDRMITEVEKYAALSGISIKLHPGTEIFYNSSLEEKLESGWLATMNGTEHVLVEFSPSDNFQYIRNAIDDRMGLGYRPIVAHVERYQCTLAKVENVRDLKRMGCKIQVNASSIAGTLGFKVKLYAKKLLKEELIDFIGTDAHDPKTRKPEIEKCAEVIRKHCSPEYADAILFENAKNDLMI